MTNSAVWYGVSQSDIIKLEQVDEMMFRACLAAPRTTPRVMLYLSTGCWPIRFIMISRRLMYLHYILQQPNDTMLRQFFDAQHLDSKPGDWCLNIQSELKSLGLHSMSYDSIKKSVTRTVTVR